MPIIDSSEIEGPLTTEWPMVDPCLLAGIEDVLNLLFEKASNLEGQWESGIVFAGFDGINGLSGDLKLVGKGCLLL